MTACRTGYSYSQRHYDGICQFPSIAGGATTGAPVGGTGSVVGTNCTICVANPTDGTPMLPAGRYVVEMIVPQATSW